jgi:hypothetical protein
MPVQPTFGPPSTLAFSPAAAATPAMPAQPRHSLTVPSSAPPTECKLPVQAAVHSLPPPFPALSPPAPMSLAAAHGAHGSGASHCSGDGAGAPCLSSDEASQTSPGACELLGGRESTAPWLVPLAKGFAARMHVAASSEVLTPGALAGQPGSIIGRRVAFTLMEELRHTNTKTGAEVTAVLPCPTTKKHARCVCACTGTGMLAPQ